MGHTITLAAAGASPLMTLNGVWPGRAVEDVCRDRLAAAVSLAVVVR